MTVAVLDLKTIGFFSLMDQASVFKFLWSPVMDRYSLPLMGRRRGLGRLAMLMSGVLALWLAGHLLTDGRVDASQGCRYGLGREVDELVLGNRCRSTLSQYTHGVRARLSRDETIPAAALRLSLAVSRAGGDKE